MAHVLIIDDEESICWGLAKTVEGLGHQADVAASAEDGLAGTFTPSLVLLDVCLPGMSGLEALQLLRQRFGAIPIIVMTAHGDLPTAVDAVQQGAFEYVVKPFTAEAMSRLIERALAAPAISETASMTAAKIEGMLGESRVMQEVFARIALAANADAGVLLVGESGTGKELAARAIHRFSARAEGPFIPVNVAALNPSLAESELFGHVRGAFTGADTSRQGLLAQAHGGTLFLDEVGDVPFELQVKLLRVLEHGVFTPVGSNQPEESNFRIVSATNCDLADGVAQGTFRRDLFYRLSAFCIQLPPLRDREDDAVLLATKFASPAEDAENALTGAVADEIRSRAWHGNVRELRNAIEHALVMARGTRIEPWHLPQPLLREPLSPAADQELGESIDRYIHRRIQRGDAAAAIHLEVLSATEKSLLVQTLARHGGNFSAAAKDLGMHRTTLRKKAAEYGLLAPE